jgi:hypothetical protein
MLEMPPTLPPDELFPCIIGTDVIYEPLHAELVANVVARRLQPGGVCILCCGVRIQVGKLRLSASSMLILCSYFVLSMLLDQIPFLIHTYFYNL